MNLGGIYQTSKDPRRFWQINAAGKVVATWRVKVLTEDILRAWRDQFAADFWDLYYS
jgi:hypothetical protein